MRTTTGWDIPGFENTPKPEPTPTPTPTPELTETGERPRATPKADRPRSRSNPLAQWYGDMLADIAARKARSDGRWWFMRWMNEQPTSVADYLYFVLHERRQRRDGRNGWGLGTEAAAIDGTHALLFRLHGLTFGLAFTLAAYALGWMAQRPGRFYLLIALTAVVIVNLNTWLAG